MTQKTLNKFFLGQIGKEIKIVWLFFLLFLLSLKLNEEREEAQWGVIKWLGKPKNGQRWDIDAEKEGLPNEGAY